LAGDEQRAEAFYKFVERACKDAWHIFAVAFGSAAGARKQRLPPLILIRDVMRSFRYAGRMVLGIRS
jgi:hypothetical protein